MKQNTVIAFKAVLIALLIGTSANALAQNPVAGSRLNLTQQGSTPSSPSAGYTTIFADNGGLVKTLLPNGTTRALLGYTSLSATAPITYDNTTGAFSIADGAISNAKLANSTISGVSLGSNLNNLTFSTGLTLDSGTTYNGGAARTLTLATSGVTAGTCTSCDLTIDTYGRVTAKANGSGGGGGISGSGTTGYIPKWSSSSALTDSIIRESSSNIGIGVSPLEKLHINGDINLGDQAMYLGGFNSPNAATVNGYLGINIKNNGSGTPVQVNTGAVSWITRFGGNFTDEFEIARIAAGGSFAGRTALFSLTPSTLLLKNSANTTIGSAEPANPEKLNVLGNLRLNNGNSQTNLNNYYAVYRDNSNLYGLTLTYKNSKFQTSLIAAHVDEVGIGFHNNASFPTAQSDITLPFRFNISGQSIIAQGTITSSNPFLSHTATWNSAGTTFTNLLSNVTDAASASASKLLDLQVDGSSKLQVRKDGLISGVAATFTGEVGANSFSTNSATYIWQGNTTYGAWQANQFSGATLGIIAATPVHPRTSDITLSGSSDTGLLLTNTGAAGQVQANLPASAVGLTYKVAVTVAQNFVIDANGTDTIRLGSSVTASGGNLTSNTIGNTLTIVCVKSGEWFVMSHEGTWTVN